MSLTRPAAPAYDSLLFYLLVFLLLNFIFFLLLLNVFFSFIVTIISHSVLLAWRYPAPTRHSHTQTGMRALSELILLPLRRPGQLQALFEQLCEATSAEHEDKESVEAAASHVAKIAARIANLREVSVREAKGRQLISAIQDLPQQYWQSRELLHSTEATEVRLNTSCILDDVLYCIDSHTSHSHNPLFSSNAVRREA
jgi:hypothetical protein